VIRVRVLQVLSNSPAYQIGGPQGVTLRIATELSKRGHEIIIFATDASDAKTRLTIVDNPMLIDGVEVYHFRNLSNQLARRQLPLTPAMAMALNKHMGDFDLVHLSEYRTVNAALVRHYAKKKSVPFVIQAHGGLPLTYNTLADRQRLRSTFDRVYGFKILRDASLVIALNEAEAKQAKQMGVDERKIRIIPNAIDPADYQNLPQPGAFRQKYGINQEDKIILYLGRISKVKGLDLLVDAFAVVLTEFSHARLVLAGPDIGFLSVLEQKIADLNLGDNAIFTGALYGRAKLEAYRDADVYVLPSVYDTFPITVLEACACGTPVIMTDRCGIAPSFKEYGLVVENDVNQLARALLKMLNDDTKRRELAQKATEFVEQEFPWSKVIEEYEKVYYEVAPNAQSIQP
jgi:glycosyltransferase involved in cell wall biosynthesis